VFLLFIVNGFLFLGSIYPRNGFKTNEGVKSCADLLCQC